MAKLSVAEEFDVAIKAASRDADPKASSRQVAEEFIESEVDLIVAFRDEWVLEKLTLLIGKYRAKMRRESNQQMKWEEMLGFGRLPKKIRRKSGEMVDSAESTIGPHREYRKFLRKQGHPALEETDRRIKLMSKYSRKERRITWAEVVEREAAKLKNK
jgi:hypothetical protein